MALVFCLLNQRDTSKDWHTCNRPTEANSNDTRQFNDLRGREGLGQDLISHNRSDGQGFMDDIMSLKLNASRQALTSCLLVIIPQTAAPGTIVAVDLARSSSLLVKLLMRLA